ncbi:hypothetical protein XA68_13277 [Ophiocordyceps unilateralis]|uniref:Uncharacterized protein n=1 Tax=Ophiocordyceps unilateralis TaxID=268505 RepID=A0A2A9PCW2_OPHUN|nr:hypothetical protein XA68_13277 [Ophiocordyceps unilateralis]
MVAFGCFVVSFLAAWAFAGSEPDSGSLLGLDQTTTYICRAGKRNHGPLYGEIGKDYAIASLLSANTTTGASGYPKPFDNSGNVLRFGRGCSHHHLWELPVLADNRPFRIHLKESESNRAGPMRVYYTRHLRFCGVAAKLSPHATGALHLCVLKKTTRRPRREPAWREGRS